MEAGNIEGDEIAGSGIACKDPVIGDTVFANASREADVGGRKAFEHSFDALVFVCGKAKIWQCIVVFRDVDTFFGVIEVNV